MRITLIISSLSAGGAERVMSIMANYWIESNNWTVTFLTFDDGKKPPFYEITKPGQINPLNLITQSRNRIHGFILNITRLKILREAIRHSKPDVVISFLDRINVVSIIANLGLNIPIIVSERVDPHHYYIGRTWELLRKMSYRWADHIVVQTESAKQYFSKRLQSRMHVIPNPVVRPPLRHPSTFNDQKRRLVALGRLTRQKGFDLLIQAFSRVSIRHQDWSLFIWGEGEERQELERIRDHLNLSNRIFLPGRTQNVNDVLGAADLFVLSSRFEGFPNSLCEAMSCGVPVISFDCRSGPSDIIRHRVDGILVPTGDVTALSESLDYLMGDEDQRNSLGFRARDICQRFSVEGIMKRWEALFKGNVFEKK